MLTNVHVHIAMVTTPDATSARHLARLILEARAAACVNILPGLESHYWWQDKIETAQEHLLIIKTTGALLDGLRELVLNNHPYTTPEFVAFPISHGSDAYLEWVRHNVGGTPRTHTRP